ncbi:MAG: hypothetical protein GX457_14445 [Thermotogaceae bacterium]|nr:hypothetical protein [Thermotogaceae bacterium]
MKRLYTVAILILLTASYASAQVVTERCWHLDKVQFLEHKQDFWRSHKMFSTSARVYAGSTGGFYNLTEVQYGFGLIVISVPFSHHYAGITSTAGWRFGGGLALGGGLGYHQYNDGYGMPVFADIRYFMGKQRVKFFFAVPGGVLMNFDDFQNYSRIFANPSLGIIVPLAKNTHLSFSAGLFSMADRDFFNTPGTPPAWRDSFVNMRLGLLFGK